VDKKNKEEIQKNVAAGSTFEHLRAQLQCRIERELAQNEAFVSNHNYSIGERVGTIAQRVYQRKAYNDTLYMDIVKIVRCYFTPEAAQR